MSKLDFRIIKKKENARVWEITLNWIKIQTPIFMPVWTKATIKWMILDLLQDQKYIWNSNTINLILANTFHLFLHPWETIIKQHWWLHKFENWNWLILTDSWWFQVFSLGLWKADKWKSLVKLQNDWVWFKSPYDWKKHFFSPEKVVDIQSDLWSDIMMMLDVCSPVHDTDKTIVAKQMETTHTWAKIAYEYFMPKYQTTKWVLFPIIQGWIHKDLREESVNYLKQFSTDWIAIWWLSVWETTQDMYEILDFLKDKLPQDKPRYFMWLWTPDEIKNAIYKGIDMFDCVLPTRLWRHGSAFSDEWIIKLKNSQYKTDFTPLTQNCNCFCCKNFSKAYLNHLVKEWEMLGAILLSLHNISYLNNLVNNIRNEILNK